MNTAVTIAQKLDGIVRLWEEAGIVQWVVSPGSRNAPIVAALLRNKNMELHAAPDERSAAYIALGIAQSNECPAAFLCTSGTALVNAFPAVCEAYYQRIPLLIVSADRPEYLIDQWDGQTLRQPGIFGTYSRHSAHINARRNTSQEFTQDIYRCVQRCIQPIPGPVHLNIALEEPIYEGIAETPFFHEVPPFVFQEFKTPHPPTLKSLHDLLAQLAVSRPKIAVVIGQQAPSHSQSEVLTNLQHALPIFADVCSHQSKHGLQGWDWGLLKRSIPKELRPDLIVTLGTTLLSKTLKSTLSEWKPAHLHIGLHGEVGDPFQTNPLSWIGFEADLLETLNIAINQDTAWREDNGQFRNQWIQFIQEQPLTIQQLEEPFSKELRWTNAFISHLTGEKHILHMGNSMPIRYASWSATCQASLYANRGVSGIDGSISTAVGSAIANPDKQIYAVVGDVSSIYDSNAFWSDIPKNLTVIIINNQGGRIFDWIAGPNQFPALRPFIHTPKNVDFSHLASFFQIPYCQLSLLEDQSSVKAALEFPGGIIELI